MRHKNTAFPHYGKIKQNKKMRKHAFCQPRRPQPALQALEQLFINA